MRRRELLLAVTSMMAARPIHAQQKPMPVIGYLGAGSPDLAAPFTAAFRQGLSESGYAEGENMAIEYRWAEGRYDRRPALAADLVDRKVGVITMVAIPATRAAKNATAGRPWSRNRAGLAQLSMTAIASISSIASGSARRLIWTVVLVGVAGPK